MLFPHRRSDELVCVLAVRWSPVIDFSLAPFFFFCAPLNIFVQKSLHFESLSGVYPLVQGIWAFLGLRCILPSAGLIIGDGLCGPLAE